MSLYILLFLIIHCVHIRNQFYLLLENMMWKNLVIKLINKNENVQIEIHCGIIRKRDALYNERNICMFSGTQLFRGQSETSRSEIKPAAFVILKQITYRFIADRYNLLDVIAPISVYQCTSSLVPRRHR